MDQENLVRSENNKRKTPGESQHQATFFSLLLPRLVHSFDTIGTKARVTSNEPLELGLHGFRKMRVVHNGIDGLLRGELLVKVGGINGARL